MMNSGYNKKYIAKGITQDLFDNGDPTNSFNFTIQDWNRVDKDGQFTASGITYIFKGKNATHRAIGTRYTSEVKISFWPKTEKGNK